MDAKKKWLKMGGTGQLLAHSDFEIQPSTYNQFLEYGPVLLPGSDSLCSRLC